MAAGGKFVDLTEDWYKNAVNWAAANNIITGTSETTFSPYDTVTREQIAAIFYRYAQSKGIDVSVDFSAMLGGHTDSDSVSDYAKLPMAWCFDEGVMFLCSPTGYEYIIGPDIAPSRADTATMFSKFSYVINSEY